MKRARFVAEARQEFLAEVAYYNEAQPGLGGRFTNVLFVTDNFMHQSKQMVYFYVQMELGKKQIFEGIARHWF